MEDGDCEYQLLVPTLAMAATVRTTNVSFPSFSQERPIKIPENLLPKRVEKEIQEGL